MKITCDREKLLHAFQTVAAVAPRRSPKPILQNVKLEVDRRRRHAHGDRPRSRHPPRSRAASMSKHPARRCCRSTRFGSILRESSDQTFHIESRRARAPRSAANAASSNCRPRTRRNSRQSPSFEEASYYEISARLFRELIRRTVFATDNESSRYALGGVKLEFGDRHASPPSAPMAAASPRWKAPSQAVGEPATDRQTSRSSPPARCS